MSSKHDETIFCDRCHLLTWHMHDGGPCPCHPTDVVHIQRRDCRYDIQLAHDIQWQYGPSMCETDIMRWAFRQRDVAALRAFDVQQWIQQFCERNERDIPPDIAGKLRYEGLWQQASMPAVFTCAAVKSVVEKIFAQWNIRLSAGWLASIDIEMSSSPYPHSMTIHFNKDRSLQHIHPITIISYPHEAYIRYYDVETASVSTLDALEISLHRMFDALRNREDQGITPFASDIVCLEELILSVLGVWLLSQKLRDQWEMRYFKNYRRQEFCVMLKSAKVQYMVKASIVHNGVAFSINGTSYAYRPFIPALITQTMHGVLRKIQSASSELMKPFIYDKDPSKKIDRWMAPSIDEMKCHIEAQINALQLRHIWAVTQGLMRHWTYPSSRQIMIELMSCQMYAVCALTLYRFDNNVFFVVGEQSWSVQDDETYKQSIDKAVRALLLLADEKISKMVELSL